MTTWYIIHSLRLAALRQFLVPVSRTKPPTSYPLATDSSHLATSEGSEVYGWPGRGLDPGTVEAAGTGSLPRDHPGHWFPALRLTSIGGSIPPGRLNRLKPSL